MHPAGDLPATSVRCFQAGPCRPARSCIPALGKPPLPLLRSSMVRKTDIRLLMARPTRLDAHRELGTLTRGTPERDEWSVSEHQGMSTTAAAVRRLRRPLVLRGVGAAALAVSAYIHVDLAAGPLFADGQITLAGLFVGQAIAASLCALWVLTRGSRLAWLVGGLVALASVAALVLTVYVFVPSIGPLPAVYEPFWYPDKAVAAGAAAVAVLAALAALLADSRAASRVRARASRAHRPEEDPGAATDPRRRNFA